MKGDKPVMLKKTPLPVSNLQLFRLLLCPTLSHVAVSVIQFPGVLYEAHFLLMQAY